MILLDQLNCVALLAGVCLDWRLQLVEQDGRGGLEWAPNCTISIQISSTSEMSLGTCLIRVFRLFESVLLFPLALLTCLRSILPWSGQVLFCRWEMSGWEGWRGNYSLCPELVRIKVACTYALPVFSWGEVGFHVTCRGEEAPLGLRGSGYQYTEYILTKAFNVPVRKQPSPRDRGQLSAADSRGVYEQINLCLLSIR